MGSPLAANKSGLVPLKTHLDFDIKGILSLNTKTALAFAKHTVRRLNEMSAPDWAYRQFLTECLLALPELNAGWIIQAQARDFFALAVECGKYVDDTTKSKIVLVARRFRDYRLLKETVTTLEHRMLTPFEFREAADTLIATSDQFSETASLLCVDAYKAHGIELRNEVKEVLKKKHCAWVNFEPEDKFVVPV